MRDRLWICLVALLAGCAPAPAPAPSMSIDPVVEVVRPEKRTIVRRIEQPGVVEAYERTAIYTKIAGYVQKWHVDVGDRVQQGQLLVELIVPELLERLQQNEAIVAQAQAQVEQARQQQAIAEKQLQTSGDEIVEAQAQVKRWAADVELRVLQANRMAGLVEANALQQELADEANKQLGSSQSARDAAVATVATKQAMQATAQAQVMKARADVSVAQAQVKVAQAGAAQLAALVAYTKVTAPYDGVITDRNVSTGDLVLPGTGDPSQGQSAEAQSAQRATPLYLMTRTDRLMFVVGVPEYDAALIQPGLPAVIQVPALGTELSLKVSRVSRRLESESRTLQAQVDVPGTGGLLPGMYAVGKITVDRAAVLAVPTSSVVEVGEHSFCFLIVDGKAKRTEVETGISDGTWIELRRKRVTLASGDPWVDFTGEESIAKSQSELTDGVAVHVSTGS